MCCGAISLGTRLRSLHLQSRVIIAVRILLKNQCETVGRQAAEKLLQPAGTAAVDRQFNLQDGG